MNLLAAVLYLCVGALLWHGLRRPRTASHGARLGIYILAVGAVTAHAAVLYTGLLHEGGLNLGFTNAASLVAWAIAVLFLLASLTRPIESLGIFIMPVAAATVFIDWLLPRHGTLIMTVTPMQSAHIVISLLAYSLLSIAVVQSLMLAWVERRLRQRHQPSRLLHALPPLETMENLMFQLITLGFVLLTLTVISGVFFSEQLFNEPLAFTDHVVLSIIAWIVFAVLLAGRWRFGWRGRTAVRWTLGGFTLLAFAYFGSKFALEILLRH
ncbi:MAG: cytochrome c biogenesis protein CcsA [Pseudomonadota bacterium]|nr:cytochrome c biogenesis protein CcsA [Pseudomonadota bacterium]